MEIKPKIAIDRVSFLLSYSLGLATWHETDFDAFVADEMIEALIPCLSVTLNGHSGEVSFQVAAARAPKERR